jgi:hypothetical protein
VRRFVSADGERLSLSELASPEKRAEGIVYRLYQP